MTAGRVQNALQQLPGMDQAYTGDFIAQADPYQVGRTTDAYNTAAGKAGELAGWLQGQVQSGAPKVDYSTQLPGMDPYNMGDRQANLDEVIRASTNPIMQRLQREILPGLKSSALDAGAYTGDRAMGVLPGQAIQAATKDMNDLALQLGYEDYNNWENRRLDAYKTDTQKQLEAYNLDTRRQNELAALEQQYLGMLPDLTNTILGQQTAQGDIYSRIADINTAVEQGKINNALQKEQYAMTRPFMGLDTAASLFRELSGNYGTQTGQSTSETVQKTGGLGSIVQGALGLAGAVGGAFMGGGAPLASLFAKSAPQLNPVNYANLSQGIRMPQF